jgi:hypothetical protein
LISAKIKYFEVIDLKYISGHRLQIFFNDGSQRNVDLSDLMKNPPQVFVTLKDPANFAKVSISAVGGIEWENGADLSAEFLRDYGTHIY